MMISKNAIAPAALYTVLALVSWSTICADEMAPTSAIKQRRILYNLDGDNCVVHKAHVKDPAAITVEDLPKIVDELSYCGSQVDTLLVCVGAKVTYYPSKLGTLRGSISSLEDRSKWSDYEHQRFANMTSFFAAGVDPYQVIIARAKQRGLETLLTFRMNDGHVQEYLRPQFWIDHPEFRLGGSMLNFAHPEVREYVFQLIAEAVERYECDGLELDFLRHPQYFEPGELSHDDQIATISTLVERIRTLLDEQGTKRNRRLTLAARVPGTLELCRNIGCDPLTWAQRGWIDFLTVSEVYYQRYDLPVKPWKKQIKNIPIYASIEALESDGHLLKPSDYRRAARHLWDDGADGIYLFNFFIPREQGPSSYEPPFELLRELGNRSWSGLVRHHPALMASYSMNETPGSSVAVDAVSGKSGVYSAGITLGHDGPRAGSFTAFESTNTAVQFNGSDDQLEINSIATLNDTTYSYEVWFNIANVSRLQFLGGRGSKSGYDAVGLNGGTLLFFNGTETVLDKLSTTPETWHHLAYTRDAKDVKVYLDGELRIRASLEISYGKSDRIVAGIRPDNALGSGLNGSLDELTVYNSALTGDEIRWHYQASRP